MQPGFDSLLTFDKAFPKLQNNGIDVKGILVVPVGYTLVSKIEIRRWVNGGITSAELQLATQNLGGGKEQFAGRFGILKQEDVGTVYNILASAVVKDNGNGILKTINSEPARVTITKGKEREPVLIGWNSTPTVRFPNANNIILDVSGYINNPPAGFAVGEKVKINAWVAGRYLWSKDTNIVDVKKVDGKLVWSGSVEFEAPPVDTILKVTAATSLTRNGEEPSTIISPVQSIKVPGR